MMRSTMRNPSRLNCSTRSSSVCKGSPCGAGARELSSASLRCTTRGWPRSSSTSRARAMQAVFHVASSRPPPRRPASLTALNAAPQNPDLMKTRLLSRSDVVEIVRKVGRDALMDAMISSLTDAFLRYDSRAVEVRKRDGFNYDRSPRTLISPEVAGGLLEWMPVLELGAASTIKMVGYNPKNPARYGIPTIMATIFQHDIK